MSYHLAGHLGAEAHGGLRSRFAEAQLRQLQRGRSMTRRVIPYFGGMGGYGGAGGLGSDATKARLKLDKAVSLNELTPAEVALVNRVWAKYDKDFAALTAGKHGKTPAQALAVLGPYPEIEKIVGHALSPIVVAPLPGTSGGSSEESSGPPWGLIVGAGAVLAVGYAVTRRGSARG